MSAWDDFKKGVKVIVKGGETKAAKAAASKPRKFEDMGKDARKAVLDRKAETEKVLKEYKKGGKVKKTGPAKLHAKERVLTVKQTKKLDKLPHLKKAIGVSKPTTSKAHKR
jgi:exonuclease VII small subunit